ncbi:ketosteroid isomerase [Rhizobium leguminosarum bv. viciae]|jgi:ketosteroid isomerase-like protein|uniref:Ketosteroid isomerase n=1 Tax=Rhizobium leguminosarum bv. viciae TaxID=387 RepID=A0A8I2GYA3_RHILV|nr:nuclear transport factor 2 family protein [Rhizobium leguminosarum]ASR07456.1 ketosteroid isomerase [Rhizobium leguminosarum bv. viciae]MBY5748710.1 ester cyclase [Rhizobium leguminosarum]MBY5795028.1 ester cyclase [Rhizobium leguminosarum]MBY5826968.1 ester cyclase [Rhizobium leguminosarum]NKM49758.1 ketosteroid isomerase [Rhizobium leguminosarum bv. viciae]
MRDDIHTIKELYAAAEGDGLDVGKFVSFFSEDAYVRDIPTDMEFRGKDIAMVAGGMAQAFPDIHRELFNIYAMEDVIVVELAIRGTHRGALVTSAGTVPPTGRTIDVPCCDVFHMRDGKVVSFHCYNAASILQRQLGLAGNATAA